MIRDQVRQFGGGATAIVMIDSAGEVEDSLDSQGNPTQWIYLGKPVTKVAAGYGTVTSAPPWSPASNWTEGRNDAWAAIGLAQVRIFNMREANNSYIETSSGVVLGNGVSHAGDYPAGFKMQSLEIGGIYPAIVITVAGELEYWVWQSNGEDGTCT